MIHLRKLLITASALTLSIALIILATGVISLPPNQSSSSAPSAATVTKSTCERPPGFILIVADLSGYNDSISHGAPVNPWPVIHVHQGNAVRLLVCNSDPTQPHGFAIGTYMDTGLALMPGDAYRITFTATIPGTFVIYCNIFCTVHIFMRAQLVVSS